MTVPVNTLWVGPLPVPDAPCFINVKIEGKLGFQLGHLLASFERKLVLYLVSIIISQTNIKSQLSNKNSLSKRTYEYL